MISAGLVAGIRWCAEDRLSAYGRMLEEEARRERLGVTLKAFHRSSARLRLVRKANQVGGTLANGAEIWWHALGRHPHRETRRDKGEGWVLVADYESLYPAFCAKLRETAPPDGVLHSDCTYKPGRGYYVGTRRMLRMADGYLVGFRSGEGQTTSLASATVDWLAFDEPPQKKHMSEAMARIARTMGPAWMTATMVGRPVKWLRRRVEGDPAKGEAPREDWRQFVIRLTQEECPWADPAELAAQIASVDADEVEQRTEAGWEGVTPDRWFSGWTAAAVFQYGTGQDAADVLPQGRNWLLTLGGDHGEDRAGAACWVLTAEDRASGQVWALDEWSNETVVSEDEIAEALLGMLARSGLTAAHVDVAVADTNSPGLGAANPRIRRFNRVLEVAMRKVLQVQRAPFEILDARKGPGSVRAGCRLVNAGLRRGSVRVSSRCVRLREALAHWKGPGVKETEHYKDIIDAFRYTAARPSGYPRPEIGGLLDLYQVAPSMRIKR